MEIAFMKQLHLHKFNIALLRYISLFIPRELSQMLDVQLGCASIAVWTDTSEIPMADFYNHDI